MNFSADLDASSFAASRVACVFDIGSSEAFDTNSDFFASDTIFDASSFASDNLRATTLSVCLIFAGHQPLSKSSPVKYPTEGVYGVMILQ